MTCLGGRTILLQLYNELQSGFLQINDPDEAKKILEQVFEVLERCNAAGSPLGPKELEIANQIFHQLLPIIQKDSN